jgi:hypothetical protein
MPFHLYSLSKYYLFDLKRCVVAWGNLGGAGVCVVCEGEAGEEEGKGISTHPPSSPPSRASRWLHFEFDDARVVNVAEVVEGSKMTSSSFPTFLVNEKIYPIKRHPQYSNSPVPSHTAQSSSIQLQPPPTPPLCLLLFSISFNIIFCYFPLCLLFCFCVVEYMLWLWLCC